MRILCVHQGYELYGSDRSFVASVRGLRRLFPDAQIIAIVPSEGPLLHFLAPLCDQVKIQPLWILRKRHFLRKIAFTWLKLPIALVRAWKWMSRSDLIYINTIAVFDYLILSRLFRQKIILHVHEIPVGMSARILHGLVAFAQVRTIFNSAATKEAFSSVSISNHHVLYNGYEGPSSCSPPRYCRERRLRVLLMGRINAWKGQDVLIEACGRLLPDIRRSLDVRIVGSTFGSHVSLERGLKRLVEKWNCSDCVAFEPFSADPSKWYEWCDLVVVPSKLPEPFGRVPIEAMSFGRGSIVSGAGGLLETVEHGVTGLHVPRNDPVALSEALARVITRPGCIEEFGKRSRERFEKYFRQDIIDDQFEIIVKTHLGPAPSVRGLTDGR